MDKIKLNDKLISSNSVFIDGVGKVTQNIGYLVKGQDINGMTLSEFIEEGFTQDRLSFLHISDNHKSNNGLAVCKNMMESNDNIAFTIVTGDIQMTDAMKDTMMSTDKPFLTLYGNHDVVDDFNYSQTRCCQEYIKAICGNKVNMGHEVASYWYKDIETASGKVVRVITFDEWEYDTLGRGAYSPSSIYTEVMSQTQINWFIDLLKSTPKDYYLVLAKHEPFGGKRTSSSVGDFISTKAHPTTYENSGLIDENIIPSIIDAYINKKIINKTYSCGDVSGTTMSINEDFSNIAPATFLFYLSGHTHWDACEYIKDYPQQLQLVVDCDKPERWQYSDLPRTSSDYCFNKVTIDFNKKETRIERIGVQTKIDGTKRIKTSFPFVK